MTVAKSRISTLSQVIEPVKNSSDDPSDRGLLTLPLGIAEAFPAWATDVWGQLRPVLAERAGAAWQIALRTQPKTLLICAAIAFLAGFGVLAVAFLASLLVLLLKTAAVMFAGLALWQWTSGAANHANSALTVTQKTVNKEATK